MHTLRPQADSSSRVTSMASDWSWQKRERSMHKGVHKGVRALFALKWALTPLSLHLYQNQGVDDCVDEQHGQPQQDLCFMG